jgi:thiol-disulfide isomerase/thioredoxin
MNRHYARLWAVGVAMLCAGASLMGQDRVVTATLSYGAPGTGPSVNFSPYGTQVPLTDVSASTSLPSGAVRPAKTGTIRIGPNERSWMNVLTTADAEHPHDLCRVYLDRNRNGNFEDDGDPLVAAPTQNEKTKAWWTSFAKTQLQVPYAQGTEPYLISMWIVREGETIPTVARYSVGSWRAGTVDVNGVPALVAVMDSNNDAVFDNKDLWSVLAASEPDAAKRVLSIAEARKMDRLMFLEAPDKERALEFRSISPDGRTVTFAVVNRAVTKKEDRAPDDEIAPERGRPRTDRAITWAHGHQGYTAALATAKQSGKKVLLDFEATWCGPCKTMDEWIWNDKEIAAAVSAGYVAVKLDGDLESALVAQYGVHGYPSGVIVDANGKPVSSVFSGYQTSAQLLLWLGAGR